MFAGLIIFPMVLSAQYKNLVIDFATKDIKIPEAKTGDYFNITVKNINLNLYKIEIVYNDSILPAGPDFPTPAVPGTDAITALLDNMKDIKTLSEALYASTRNPGTKGLNADKFLMPPQNKGKNQTADNKKEKILPELANNQTFIHQQENNIKKLTLSIDSLELKVKALGVSYLLLDTGLQRSLISGFSYSSILWASNRIHDRIRTMISLVETWHNDFRGFFQTQGPDIINDTLLNDICSKLENGYSELLDKAFGLEDSLRSDKIGKWLQSMAMLQNNAVTKYTTLPILIKGDFARVKIAIKPLSKEFTLPDYKTELIFPGPPPRYIGTGMSFYYSGLYDEAYSVKAFAGKDSTVYSLVDENAMHGEIGIATLLHFGRKFKGDCVGYHLAIGPAISFSKPVKPRLMLGLGFSAGRKQLITADILFAGGYCERKSNAFELGKEYSAEPAQVTVSKLKISYAIALGYTYKF